MSDIQIEASQLNREVVESKAMLGKECITCYRILEYKFFQKDSSYRDGWRDQCLVCQNAPVMSTDEHVWSQREKNYLAASSQRWDHQEDYRDDAARLGRTMHHSELLLHLRRLIPNLYVTDGRIAGDLALYRTYGFPQSRLNGNSFEYLFYMPTGIMPEFSQYEFDEYRNVLIRESKRGWRTVTLRLIKGGFITEEVANHIFGPAEGAGSTVYCRKLWEWRNAKTATS
jgi:hypothetical protein